ncbi:D-isomer specific 2-hydroxyacid dehydrogenase, catalytic domain containing protein [Nitzschia inconspicua]|uniref:2-oxoglutarate reductase n=1 Tax=Nitzschia inconspicua TaxID=303405 RepID=A0A9K3PRE4_9STRA|nr:D-isomer specific 2-hydroxyacid dehydrogenase, catalytic domain containing protein [Nitzschia inconspicua]
MALLRITATRTALRVPFIGTKATTVVPASLSARCYSGHPIKVTHYESGWTADGVDDSIKGIEKYCTQTFNKISQVGLSVFPKDLYDVIPRDEANGRPAHALMLRSHKLQEDQVDPSVRAIARCGAGTNNIPVARMTELGIPVFNTPGANANAVKELVLCGLFLGSRRVIDGINHMKDLGKQGLARERVEKDKALFGGREIKGKRLAVIGLGHIGAATARDAHSLGMDLVGYDPGLSVKSAMKLPRNMDLADSISSAVANADYISLNIPYIKGTPEEGGTHGIIGQAVLRHMKSDAVILNFARGELVDSVAMKEFLDKGGEGRYISDFPDDVLWNHENVVIIPHLGASTGEAEDSAAAMAAETLRLYLEHGTIRHSVNFPDTSLQEKDSNHIRITVVNKNKPGVLSAITDVFAKHGLNIVQQINHSRGEIAYNVIDIEPAAGDSHDLRELQKELTMHDGILSSRIMGGVAGNGYARNIEGTYYA